MNVQGQPRTSAQAPAAAGPVRTCVGCRARGHQGDLLRVVLEAGRLTPDPRRVLPGRGAYVHPVRECVTTAIARKAFGKALRARGSLDTSVLADCELILSEPGVGSVGMTTR